jgi:membrane associated rhomboid family serine protease
MRSWYRKTAKNEDFPQPTFITPFSRLWGYGTPITLALIIINSAIWLAMVITSGFKWLPLDTWWYHYFAMTPMLVIHKHWIHQILTSIFLHDGSDILHLAMNMYILWIFGPQVERILGSRGYLFFYLATGIAGSILSLVIRQLTGFAGVPSLGASAAVFGVLTAFGFLFANDLLYLFFVIPMRAWKTVVLFIAIETLLTIIPGIMPDVDHYAHLGGAAAAAIWILVRSKIQDKRSTHEWYHVGKNVSYYIPRKRSGTSGFKVIVGSMHPLKHADHPEGTDDEPPPKWFKV